MRRDVTRTVIVVAELPHLWGAVQERLHPELGLVRHARPAELAEVWLRADPWPWIIVGATTAAPPGLAELAANKPIPIWWLGSAEGLPDCTVGLADWQELAAQLDRLRRPVVGLRFAPRRGVRDESRHYTRDTADLEGLMAAHPRGLPRFETLRRLRNLITRYDLPCEVKVGDGGVTLTPHPRRREEWL